MNRNTCPLRAAATARLQRMANELGGCTEPHPMRSTRKPYRRYMDHRQSSRAACDELLRQDVRCSSVRSRQASGSRRPWVARLRVHRVRGLGRKASALLVISGGSAEAHGTEFHSRLFRLASSLLPSLPSSLPYVRPCGQFSEPDGHFGFATNLSW